MTIEQWVARKSRLIELEDKNDTTANIMSQQISSNDEIDIIFKQVYNIKMFNYLSQ